MRVISLKKCKEMFENGDFERRKKKKEEGTIKKSRDGDENHEYEYV